MDKQMNDDGSLAEYERIFERYLEVCNEAIEKNKDAFPYMELWKARWANFETDTILQFAVYDDRPKVIYTLKLTAGMRIEILRKQQTAHKDAWPLKLSYLKHVVDNPENYLEHPATLDWGWLTEVFG